MRALVGAACGLSLLSTATGSPAAEPFGVQVVSRAQIGAAMASIGGYDPTATPNGARVQAEVLLALAREAITKAPEGPPLFIDHADWYHAFLERVGLGPDKAPLYARLAYENKQDTFVDYRRNRILEASGNDPLPQLALSVRTAWAAGPGVRSSYSYDDTFSTPTLRVSFERVLTYSLLDYGDMLLYADVRGLRGRPTSGALGLLFSLIGEAHVVESRMAFAADGTQVCVGRGHRGPFSASATVTILPSGKADRGVSADRPDLQALESRLRRPLKLRLVPSTWPQDGPTLR